MNTESANLNKVFSVFAAEPGNASEGSEAADRKILSRLPFHVSRLSAPARSAAAAAAATTASARRTAR